MEIKLAEISGFCFGVRRAVEMAQQALSKDEKKTYSIGPLIHNPQVVAELSSKGLQVVEDLNGIAEAKVIIRSHGAVPQFIDEVNERGLELIDATCPFVKKCQRLARELEDEGFAVVIVGDKGHPEVKSVLGCMKKAAFVVNSEKDVRGLNLKARRIGIIAQTTQSRQNFIRVVSAFLELRCFENRIFNTICDDTLKRQELALQLAREVDVMLVLGGKMSANTRRLAEICRQVCPFVYHVETADEVDPVWLREKKRVGLTSGASTPDWILQDAVKKVKNLK